MFQSPWSLSSHLLTPSFLLDVRPQWHSGWAWDSWCSLPRHSFFPPHPLRTPGPRVAHFVPNRSSFKWWKLSWHHLLLRLERSCCTLVPARDCCTQRFHHVHGDVTVMSVILMFLLWKATKGQHVPRKKSSQVVSFHLRYYETHHLPGWGTTFLSILLTLYTTYYVYIYISYIMHYHVLCFWVCFITFMAWTQGVFFHR